MSPDHVHRTRLTVVALAAAGLLAAAASISLPSQAASTSHRGSKVHPSPSHFTHGRVTNPWFPLKPGSRYVYRGTEDHDGRTDQTARGCQAAAPSMGDPAAYADRRCIRFTGHTS